MSLTLTVFKDGFSFPSKMINSHCVIVFPPGYCFPASPPPSLNHSPLCARHQAVEQKREKKNFSFPMFPPPCSCVSSIQNPCNLLWQEQAGKKCRSFPAVNAK